ncbi:hypothetical protein [Rummeliibacillus sp. SL167]|uniref:hypothetical protein n=1 Tax=Rummeliibacillus sp. SL167 TaxID=2579792 RepID=UPI0011B80171|nr:hypothetical protein [Rummeliibacillus sp. SL167]
MKRKKFMVVILVVFISTFGVVACEDQQNEDQQPKGVSNQISLEGKFTPPNFKVDEFKVKSDHKSVEFEIFYKVSPSLYTLLKKIDSKYYLELQLPKNISSIVKQNHTALVPGAVMKSDNSLAYKVTLNLNLAKPLTNDEKKKLLQSKEGYGLYIYDQDKDAIHYFDDVELLSTVP